MTTRAQNPPKSPDRGPAPAEPAAQNPISGPRRDLRDRSIVRNRPKFRQSVADGPLIFIGRPTEQRAPMPCGAPRLLLPSESRRSRPALPLFVPREAGKLPRRRLPPRGCACGSQGRQRGRRGRPAGWPLPARPTPPPSYRSEGRFEHQLGEVHSRSSRFRAPPSPAHGTTGRTVIRGCEGLHRRRDVIQPPERRPPRCRPESPGARPSRG